VIVNQDLVVGPNGRSFPSLDEAIDDAQQILRDNRNPLTGFPSSSEEASDGHSFFYKSMILSKRKKTKTI
jgi:hypothetical protein